MKVGSSCSPGAYIHEYNLPHLLKLSHSRETFIEREPGESSNDRNDRAIRVAAKWYSQHLKTSEAGADGLRVVLITNDQGNKEKAAESGLLVYKCKHQGQGNVMAYNSISFYKMTI